jgi:hypothetical protein
VPEGRATFTTHGRSVEVLALVPNDASPGCAVHGGWIAGTPFANIDEQPQVDIHIADATVTLEPRVLGLLIKLADGLAPLGVLGGRVPPATPHPPPASGLGLGAASRPPSLPRGALEQMQMRRRRETPPPTVQVQTLSTGRLS